MQEYPLLSNSQIQSTGNLCVNFTRQLNKTGLYTALKGSDQYEVAKDHLAGFLGGLIQHKANERFHNSLNIFEKMGFLSSAKQSAHQKKMGFVSGSADFLVRASCDLLLFSYDSFQKNRTVNRLIDNYLALLAYIEQSPSLASRHGINKLHVDLGMKTDEARIKAAYDKYANSNLSFLPNHLRDENEERYPIYNALIGSVDLEDESVRERCMEVGDFLKLSNVDIDEQLSIANDSSKLLADNLTLAGVTVNTLLRDMVANANKSSEIAGYCIDNDPFRKTRVERKQKITKAAVYAGMAGLTFYCGPLGDAAIVLATPMVNDLLNEEIDIDKTVEIHDALKKAKEDVEMLKARNFNGK